MKTGIATKYKCRMCNSPFTNFVIDDINKEGQFSMNHGSFQVLISKESIEKYGKMKMWNIGHIHIDVFIPVQIIMHNCSKTKTGVADFIGVERIVV